MRPDEVLRDAGLLNSLMHDHGRWTNGTVRSCHVAPIGDGYGLSGRIYRLRVTTMSDDVATLVAKIEDPGRTGRAIAAHRHLAAVMDSSMPATFGWLVDQDSGILLLEDIHPALQGDELHPPGRVSALGIAAIVADLHACTAGTVAPDHAFETWHARAVDASWWGTRVDTMADRYRSVLPHDITDRLIPLHIEAATAAVELGDGDTTWIHVDPHLDNVRWRSDGSPVLLDWSNACIGPPAIDVATMLFSLAFCDAPPLTPAELIDEYTTMRRKGCERAPRDIESTARLALAIYLRGIVGWCGEPSNDGYHPRKELLRDDAARRVPTALDWYDRT